MALDIRDATLGDVEPLTRLLLQLGYDAEDRIVRRRLERVLARSDHGVFVAVERPHGVVGLVHTCAMNALYHRPFADVLVLVVAVNHRRAGVGRGLMEHVHEWATRRGIDDVYVAAQLHRREAPAFFDAIGYSQHKEERVFARDLSTPGEAGERTGHD